MAEIKRNNKIFFIRTHQHRGGTGLPDPSLLDNFDIDWSTHGGNFIFYSLFPDAPSPSLMGRDTHRVVQRTELLDQLRLIGSGAEPLDVMYLPPEQYCIVS
jgi:hypothetical protein